MIKQITSKENKIIKLILSLRKRSGRSKSGMFLAEGKRIVDEALMWSKGSISFLAASESFYEKNPYCSCGLDLYILPDSLFNYISDTETPQGILAVIKIPLSSSCEDLSDNILIIDGVSEPGNMGTILRTAEAMGFNDIFILKGSADIYSPKVVRSTMGAIFRLRFHFEDSCEFIAMLKERRYRIISAALRDSVSLEAVEVFKKNAIVVGNEAVGISDTLLNCSDIRAKIEMPGKAESLNVSVAAGIMMYKFSSKD